MERIELPELVDRLPDYLTLDQVHILRSVCAGHPRVFAMVVLLLETGMRAGELLRLSTADVDLESSERRIIICGINSKAKKDRIIYLSAETTRALQTYLRGRPDSATPVYFLNRFGDPFPINALEKLLIFGQPSDWLAYRLSDIDEVKKWRDNPNQLLPQPLFYSKEETRCPKEYVNP